MSCFLQNAAKQAAAAATQTIAAAQHAASSNKNQAAQQQLVQSCKVNTWPTCLHCTDGTYLWTEWLSLFSLPLFCLFSSSLHYLYYSYLLFASFWIQPKFKTSSIYEVKLNFNTYCKDILTGTYNKKNPPCGYSSVFPFSKYSIVLYRSLCCTSEACNLISVRLEMRCIDILCVNESAVICF